MTRKLTTKELQILKLLTEGKSNREIAMELNIKEQTVKNSLSKLFLKLGVTNRTQAAVKGIEMKEDKIIPIFDCPFCGKKDQPASHHGPYIKRINDEKGRFIKGGYKEIHIWSCPVCDKVLNLDKDFKPKKWITIKELEEMGWKEEKQSENNAKRSS